MCWRICLIAAPRSCPRKPAIAAAWSDADEHFNTTGQLLLTTGNKSEYATGYATLYGDSGGYAPLIDVWKTEVCPLQLA